MELISVLGSFYPYAVFLGAFLVTFFLLPAIIDVSHLKNLVDDPEDERKLHIDHTPNLGGIAIFATVFIVFSLSGFALQSWSPYLAAGLTMLFFSGVKDDILIISPVKKLLIQVGAIAALMIGGGLVITDLGGVFGLHGIPYWAGFGLTFFTMVVVVNSYNLIDGIDGLAAGIGTIASLFFGCWFWAVGMPAHAVMAFITAGSLVAFMGYNFQPASIFMGDTGSQVVGYLLAFLAVSFVQVGVTAEAAVPFQNAVPVLVLSVLIVPLYDTLRVFTVRALTGNSPFDADRRHVHHQLIDLGFSHRACCYILYTYTAGIIAMTVLLAGMEVNILLAGVLLTTVLLFPTMHIKRDILEQAGIEMPSSRQIKVLEMKYGMPPRDVDKPRNNGSGDNEKKEALEEIAV